MDKQLATNVLDSTILSADQALPEYKDQQANERGFRFLKDPLFFTKECVSQVASTSDGSGNGDGVISVWATASS